MLYRRLYMRIDDGNVPLGLTYRKPETARRQERTRTVQGDIQGSDRRGGLRRAEFRRGAPFLAASGRAQPCRDASRGPPSMQRESMTVEAESIKQLTIETDARECGSASHYVMTLLQDGANPTGRAPRPTFSPVSMSLRQVGARDPQQRFTLLTNLFGLEC